MKWVIKEVDLDSERPGVIVGHPANRLEGRKMLEEFRAKRGPWKENSIVHALMRAEAA